MRFRKVSQLRREGAGGRDKMAGICGCRKPPREDGVGIADL